MGFTFPRRGSEGRRRSSVVELLKVFPEREPFEFNGIRTRDESCFQYHYQSQEMFAPSQEQVAPCVRTKLGIHKVMIILFFTFTMLVVHEALPKRRKFIQNHSISSVLLWLMGKTTIHKEKSQRRLPAPYVQFYTSQ
jgi:hypothetical protein